MHQWGMLVAVAVFLVAAPQCSGLSLRQSAGRLQETKVRVAAMGLEYRPTNDKALEYMCGAVVAASLVQEQGRAAPAPRRRRLIVAAPALPESSSTRVQEQWQQEQWQLWVYMRDQQATADGYTTADWTMQQAMEAAAMKSAGGDLVESAGGPAEVEASFRSVLTLLGAQIKSVAPGDEVPHACASAAASRGATYSSLSMFWRLRVMDDPSVAQFVVVDADEPLQLPDLISYADSLTSRKPAGWTFWHDTTRERPGTAFEGNFFGARHLQLPTTIHAMEEQFCTAELAKHWGPLNFEHLITDDMVATVGAANVAQRGDSDQWDYRRDEMFDREYLLPSFRTAGLMSVTKTSVTSQLLARGKTEETVEAHDGTTRLAVHFASGNGGYPREYCNMKVFPKAVLASHKLPTKLSASVSSTGKRLAALHSPAAATVAHLCGF